MDAVNTQTNNYVHEASSTLIGLARLLGRQAAREMAALETKANTTPNGGSDEQSQACASDDA
jgi:hypothetical protein